MVPIRCFLVEASGRVKLTLRRYANYNLPEAERVCSHRYGYHNAEVEIGEMQALCDPDGHLMCLPETPPTDPRWPLTCDECGYVFAEGDEWQTSQDTIYVPAQGNEGVEPHQWTIRELPAGAMLYPSWFQPRDGEQNELPGYTEPTEGKVLMVIIPSEPDGSGTTQWLVDAYCSNCDRKGERHHCWCRHGVAPWITVNKTPPDALGTCGAGAGSIWSRMPHGWHGFLQNGFLVNA